MSKKFQFSEKEENEIYEKAIGLLKRHNHQLSLTNKRLLTKDDESFISGCKANINYGTQSKLSAKQLRRLSVLVKKHTLEKKEPPLVADTDSFTSKQLKLKEIILRYAEKSK